MVLVTPPPKSNPPQYTKPPTQYTRPPTQYTRPPSPSNPAPTQQYTRPPTQQYTKPPTQYTRPPSPTQYPRQSTPPVSTKIVPKESELNEQKPKDATATQLYNHLLEHILTKSDLSPDVSAGTMQKAYLSTNRMRLILLKAIRAIDPSGTFSVKSQREESGKYYVDISLILGGRPVPLEFKSYFAGWEDFKHILTEKNIGHLVNAIERQICCSQQYAVRRLFSFFLGINEDHNKTNTEVNNEIRNNRKT